MEDVGCEGMGIILWCSYGKCRGVKVFEMKWCEVIGIVGLCRYGKCRGVKV